MRFDQRAFRYLWRKKSKSVLLFCILLVISTMVLSAAMILQTAQATSNAIREKTNSKVVLQSQSGKNSISAELIAQITSLENVSSINRTASSTAYPVNFLPVTYKESVEPENLTVTMQAYDNTESDGLFAEEKYRLLDGTAINEEHPQGILINSLLAQANGLEIGDWLEFETQDGTSASGEITGIFFSGMEQKQEDSILSAYRIENQIFVDHSLFETLFGGQGFSSVSVYTSAPEQMDILCDEILLLAGEKINLTTSDALYSQIQAPLQQVIHITTLVLFLTLITAAIVVSLLLCMWMRTRQKEFAIFISLGESKWNLLLQVITESAALFLLSAFGAAVCTNLFSSRIMQFLFSSEELGGMMDAHIQGQHLMMLIILGGSIVLLAIGISIFPTLRANPRDTLSRMEG